MWRVIKRLALPQNLLKVSGLVSVLVCGIVFAAQDGAETSAEIDARAVARLNQPPLGLPPVDVPVSNPANAKKVALGRKLFFDRRLSHNRTMSCAMCHIPEQGFTINEAATPVGVKGRSLSRNSPTTYNVAYARTMFHDSRESTLENQVLSPFFAEDEMALPSVAYLLDTINAAPDYNGLFEQVFGKTANVINIGEALASYQRTVLSANSRFDRWYFGKEEGALSAEEIDGFELFTGSAGCSGCHLIHDDFALFTDHAVHNTGVGVQRSVDKQKSMAPVSVELIPGVTVPIKLRAGKSKAAMSPQDLGRMAITDRVEDLYAFKTPMLRNVALTAPYMHDGSLQTLKDVVGFYNEGGVENEALDPRIKPLSLNEQEISALVAFLNSLTGDNVAELIREARSTPIGN